MNLNKKQIQEKYNTSPKMYTVFLRVMDELLFLRGHREKLLSHVEGRTLEVAAGSGLNLFHYTNSCRLTLTDMSEKMLGTSVRIAKRIGRKASFYLADAERLPFREGYFDTSIWLDFLEDRNEPNFPKSQWARKLVDKIINENYKIILSNVNYKELEKAGYSRYDIKEILAPIRRIIHLISSTNNQITRAQDLAFKRSIPRLDALHALIARDNRAIFVTFDHHFRKITDIIKSHRPEELI